MAGRFEQPAADAALTETFKALLAPVRAEGRTALTEKEGLRLLEAMGIPIPGNRMFANASELMRAFASQAGAATEPSAGAAIKPSAGARLFPGERAVVKVISPEILHKTEQGGVAIVPNTQDAIVAAVRDMETRFAGMRVDGYTINEYISFTPSLGHELIFGYRFAADFGPVISFGPGGIYTEYLADKFKSGVANIFFSPRTATRELVEKTLAHNVAYTLLCGGLRNTKPVLDGARVVDAIMAFIAAADSLAAAGIAEFEVNPMVTASRISSLGERRTELVALDCLVTLGDFSRYGLCEKPDGTPCNAAQEARPVAQIGHILVPQSAAIIGVSEKIINNGRIILRNLLNNGFAKDRIYIVKKDTAEIDECPCVPDIDSLPEKVDLFILVIPASGAPEVLAEIAQQDKAWSVIVIPGGFEEKSGSQRIVAGMKKALADARAQGKGPLINGGNCLGIRSVPGKYNTLFIPEHKLPISRGKEDPLAIISQSGAFAITRISKHPLINPRYILTLGNQMDLTIGDYLDYMKNDSNIRVFAVYVEGFKALDGVKTVKACKDIITSGRAVIFYRAGRTAAGAGAAASHTASIAGDFPVTAALLQQIGVTVCTSLQDFDEAITLFTWLDKKRTTGKKLVSISSAGFECVAMADNLGAMQLATLSESTAARLASVFAESRISDIVDVHNPLDVTPMANDKAYDESFRALLLNEDTDIGVVGIVPLSVMMNTLLAAPGEHDEDVSQPGSLPQRLGAFSNICKKPFVAVVDTGPLYDPLCRQLEYAGIPVFRAADRALHMLNLWLASPASRPASPPSRPQGVNA